MERNILCNNLKDHSLGGKTIMIDKNKAKDHPWKYHSSCCSDSHGGSGDLLDGFPWPPKSYTCSFCKREFRSAQALGGHMNVHRRDRARLRMQQSPPRDHINGQYPFLNPNPNPNFSSSSQSSSSSTRFHLLTSTLTPLVSAPSAPSTLSSPPPASLTDQSNKWGMNSALLDLLSKKEAHLTKMKNSKALSDVGEFDEGEFRVSNKAEIVSLDLEIGVLSNSKVVDLDLELRLGYS